MEQQSITPKQLLQNLQWRYATKVFDRSKKISPELWETIEDCLVLTPSSLGLQPWKFIIITNDEVKAELRPHSWGQPQITDCSHLVVLCAKKSVTESNMESYLNLIAKTRQVSRESLDGYAEMMKGFVGSMDAEKSLAWAKNQVYIALGQLMTSAAVLGIDACPLEGITPAEYDRILGLEDSEYTTAVACAMGYRSADDKYATVPKTRYNKEDVITRI